MKIIRLLLLISILVPKAVLATSACTTEDWNNVECGGYYCEVYYMDPICYEPITCTYGDWIPAICDVALGNRDYCEVHPTDLINCPFR